MDKQNGNNDVGHFIADIQNTLNKNGFPEKKVALPLEKMYEVAHKKGINFNKVLNFLESKGVWHTKTAEKIIFSSNASEVNAEELPTGEVHLQEEQKTNSDTFDFSMFAGMDLNQLMKSATEMMKNMTPEQMKLIKDKMGSFSHSN
ncbi:MAG: hypothetical protein R3B45_06315 [Bdellovibrionota bacterium]